MPARGVEINPDFQGQHGKPAPITSAGFSFFEGTDLRHPELDQDSAVAEPDYVACTNPAILELILNSDLQRDRGIYLDALGDLQNHMSGLLYDENDWYDRRKLAAGYAESYRSQLDIDEPDFDDDQQSALVLSKVYLSSISSLAREGQMMYTRFWMGKKSPEMTESKKMYLAARKIFQDDVDNYFDHFYDEPAESVCEVLQDTVNMARLLVNKKRWVDSLTSTYNHVFLGSVLSERVIRTSLQENGYPQARYGSPEEDSSPIKADVVVPLPQGDMHVQVKMKWQEPTELDIRPDKRPFHVIVPMYIIRAGLSSKEEEILAASVDEEVEKLAA